jgi:hypothetical protein
MTFAAHRAWRSLKVEPVTFPTGYPNSSLKIRE